MRVETRHQWLPKQENRKRWDQSRATELELMQKLRMMSRSHKAEVKRLENELAAATNAILRLKEELNSMRLRARR